MHCHVHITLHHLFKKIHSLSTRRAHSQVEASITSLVWTPDPSGHTRKGLGNNLARKCLERWNAAVGVDEGKNVFQPTSVRVLLMTGSDIR